LVFILPKVQIVILAKARIQRTGTGARPYLELRARVVFFRFRADLWNERQWTGDIFWRAWTLD